MMASGAAQSAATAVGDEEVSMPAEILVCVLGAVTLIVVAVTEALGFLGIVGALRFRSCRSCARWTLHADAAQPLCGRCKRLQTRVPRGEVLRWRVPHLGVHLLHVGH